MRQRLFDQVVRLGPSHFDRKRTGDVTVGVIEGVEQLETFFGQYLPQLIVAALAPIGIFIFMGWLDLPVAAIYFGFALVTLLLPAVAEAEECGSIVAAAGRVRVVRGGLPRLGCRVWRR